MDFSTEPSFVADWEEIILLDSLLATAIASVGKSNTGPDSRYLGKSAEEGLLLRDCALVLCPTLSFMLY